MFATLLFALAMSLKIVHRLNEQGRTINLLFSITIFSFSLFMHYWLIYMKKKDREIPLFHRTHHLSMVKFYIFVVSIVVLLLWLDFLL
ncbi:MAG: hypothetical protein QXK37_04510 [Candidatus Woesearchaeota archaeon]